MAHALILHYYVPAASIINDTREAVIFLGLIQFPPNLTKTLMWTMVEDATGLFKGNLLKGNLLKGNPRKVKDGELGAFFDIIKSDLGWVHLHPRIKQKIAEDAHDLWTS